MLALGLLAALALLCWAGLLLHPARPWDMRPVGEDEPEAALPAAPPPVAVVVPARNEAESLPRTLPSLLAQEYPGTWRVVIVDDRSSDGTAAVARRIGEERGAAGRLLVVEGQALPPGWVGKVWAMQQGLQAAGALAPGGPRWVLLTDADIAHDPGSLRRLVGEAERDGLTLSSRMARLSCATPAERLLIPAFAFFFATLYPMRRVNAPGSRTAAAAGGCMLLRADALAAMGGVEPIRDRIIDDVSLAREVLARGGTLRLARSERDVVSLRVYERVADVWRMVRRSAFTELRHSWARLAACLLALGLVFVVPPAALVAGSMAGRVSVAGLGAAAWGASALAYAPAIRRFGLPAWRALTLPLAGVLYGAMTLDSALRHALGRREAWRAAGR